MRTLGYRSLLLTALVLPCWPTRAAEAQPTEVETPELVRANELYRRGNEAYQAKRLDEAYLLYREAFSLKKAYDIAGNLGAVEFELKKYRDAAEHLAFSLRGFPVNGNPDARAKTLKYLGDAKREVGTYTVDCNAKGAAISVDAQQIAVSPVANDVFLEPGKRTVTATLEGYEDFTLEVTVAPGKTDKIKILLERKAGGPIEGGGRESFPLWPGLVIGGVGVVGLAVGGGLLGASFGSKSDAEDEGTGLNCGTNGGASSCNDLRSTADDVNTLGNAGLGTLIAGGALTATGVILVIVSATDSASPTDSQQAAYPIVAPGLLGAGFFTSF